MKKLSALALVLIMLLTLSVSAFASPLEVFYTADININNPGNPRADKPVYSYAWLDNIIVRSDPNAVISTVYKPAPEDYVYSHTYEEFITEVDNYSLLFKLDETTVGAAYQELTTYIYYAVTAMGFTTDYETMCEYLQSCGIELSGNAVENAMAVSIVYAALKYNAVYVLYEKQVEIPKGATVDYALIIILSELTATSLPSGIDSYTGLGLLAIKNYVTGFDELPISDNPDANEIFHWAKVITASENNYQVPVVSYDEATRAQKEYVDYLYYASIINTLYDVNVNPIYLVLAMQSPEENSLQKFILKSMLDEKKVGYAQEAGCEELFVLACQSGCFSLEDDFYTDIFTYEMTVPSDCQKVWFTPFALASQLEGGDDAYVTVYLNGVQMAPNTTVSTPLDVTKAEETVALRVIYDDGQNEFQQAEYKFIVKKTASSAEKQPEAGNSVIGQVEQFIGTIIPDSNTVANDKVNEIFSSIGSAFSQVGANIDKNLLTTYGSQSVTVANSNAAAVNGQQDVTLSPGTSDRFDFNYLEQLIDGVYVTDANGNIVTTSSLYGNDDSEEADNIIQKVTQTVKESPEIVAVPSSLLAAFSVMGYFTTKKHRDGSVVEFEDEKTDDETESDA